MKKNLLILLLFFPVMAYAAPGPITVLLLDGESSGTYHNWQLTTPVLKRELEETGMFTVTVLTAPHSGTDFGGFHPDFTKYQLIVSNYDAPDWPALIRTQFEQYMKNGGGFVVVHAADNSFPDWPAYNEMIGVGGWRHRDEKAGPEWYFADGKLVSDPAAGPAGSHGNRLPFQMITQAPEHPIMKGLPHLWMHASDELYSTLRGPAKNVTVLATAHSDPTNNGTDRDEPMLMVIQYGKGRIFHTTLGHDPYALSCIGFITTFLRGAEWAATGKVTQKIPVNFPSADVVSYRVDIARMDPAFSKVARTASTPPVTSKTLAVPAK